MKIIGTLIAATVLFCGSAQAQDNRAAPAESIHYGWADVLRVDPIYDEQMQQPAAAHEECYEEQVQQPPAADTRAGSTILGAIIGGVLGHSVGKGNGRTVATAAGVAVGAAVGNNVAQSGDRGNLSERHCRMVGGSAGERHAAAYDVEYRYRGEVYTARMSYDPGDRIRVRISVTPAE